MQISIPPVSPVKERPAENSAPRARRPLESKVLGFVLEHISRAKGGLLPSATAPQIVIDLGPVVDGKRGHKSSRDAKKRMLRKTPLVRKAPIGLKPVDPEGWVNALMQFILFVPGLAELFFFAPRSFSPFPEFIDHYFHDQQLNQGISSANGSAIYRFLTLKYPKLSFHELFQSLLQVLHPKWELHKNIEEAKEKGGASDVFVRESSAQKQFFSPAELVCYDLDAFIELRPDGNAANFVAYVKVEGGWYQCDDDQITQLRSNHLIAPLQRAILLHYKRIGFGKTGWN